MDLERFGYRQLELRDGAVVDVFVADVGALDVLVNNWRRDVPHGRDELAPSAFAVALVLNVEGAMRLTVGCRASPSP